MKHEVVAVILQMAGFGFQGATYSLFLEEQVILIDIHREKLRKSRYITNVRIIMSREDYSNAASVHSSVWSNS